MFYSSLLTSMLLIYKCVIAVAELCSDSIIALILLFF